MLRKWDISPSLTFGPDTVTFLLKIRCGKKGENELDNGKPDKPISQVIKVNISSDKSVDSTHVYFWCNMMKTALYLWVLPPKNP